MKSIVLALISLMYISGDSCQGNYTSSYVKGSVDSMISADKEVDLPAFHGVSNSIHADVTIKQGSTQRVNVEGPQEMLDLLELEVKSGILHIGYNKRNVRNTKKVYFDISLPKLDYASVSGSGDIEGSGFSGGDKLKLRVTGSGSINMDAKTDRMEVHITGSGKIRCKGSAQDGSVSITGSGGYHGENFIMQAAEVSITGSGDAEMHVTGELSGNITGSGDVIGHGNPRAKMKITGSGSYKDA